MSIKKLQKEVEFNYEDELKKSFEETYRKGRKDMFVKLCSILINNMSLKDKSNGRYNREIELREDLNKELKNVFNNTEKEYAKVKDILGLKMDIEEINNL